MPRYVRIKLKNLNVPLSIVLRDVFSITRNTFLFLTKSMDMNMKFILKCNLINDSFCLDSFTPISLIKFYFHKDR